MDVDDRSSAGPPPSGSDRPESLPRPYSRIWRHLYRLLATTVAVLAALSLIASEEWALPLVNLMWLTAAAAAALDAWTSPRGASREGRRIQNLLEVSLYIYLGAQLVWIVQVAADYAVVPGPSDLGFILSGVIAGGAFLRLLRAQLPASERFLANLDLAIIFLAAATALLAARPEIFLRFEAEATLTLFLYPMLYLVPAASGAIVVVSSRERLRSGAGRSLILAWLLLGTGFTLWTEAAIRGTAFPGNPADYLFAIGLLAAGRGLRRWSRDEDRLLDHSRSTQRLVDLLPGLWIGLSLVVYFPMLGRPRLAEVVIWLPFALLIATVTARQFLLARHRRKALEREETARRSETETLARFGLVADTIQESFWITGPSLSELIYVSPGFEKVFGHTVEWLEEDPTRFLDMVHPDDRDRVERTLAERLATEGFDHEYRIVRPDRSTRTIHDRAVAVRNESGEIVRFVGVAVDTTSQHATHQMGLLLAEAVERADESVLIANETGSIVMANSASARTSGYPVGEVIGRPLEFLAADAASKRDYETLWDTVRTGGVWRGILRSRSRSGRVLVEQVVVVPVAHHLQNDVINYVAVKRDLTTQREMERQLLQAQKMEAVGRLAGGVAHDFNNLLTAIINFTEFASSSESIDEARRDLDQALEAARRASDLTRQLLAFSRKQVLQAQPLKVREVLEAVYSLTHRLVPESVGFELAVPPDDVTVNCDRGQIEQVFMNLIVNSLDAMPEGGSLYLESDEVVIGRRGPLLSSDVPPGRYVRMTVRDTGTGMDDHTRSKIFEPFFTTKDSGKGSGLGLSTSYGIVRQSGGTLVAESAPGRGTAMRVLLPRVDRILEDHETPPARREDRPEGSEPILVVEDDPVVRGVLKRTLRRYGYRPTVVSDAESALELLENDLEVAALVTDLMLPGLDGQELARRFVAARPEGRVLLISGYVGDEFNRSLPIDSRSAYLPKPFRSSDLLVALRRLLDRRAPPGPESGGSPEDEDEDEDEVR